MTEYTLERFYGDFYSRHISIILEHLTSEKAYQGILDNLGLLVTNCIYCPRLNMFYLDREWQSLDTTHPAWQSLIDVPSKEEIVTTIDMDGVYLWYHNYYSFYVRKCQREEIKIS